MTLKFHLHIYDETAETRQLSSELGSIIKHSSYNKIFLSCRLCITLYRFVKDLQSRTVNSVRKTQFDSTVLFNCQCVHITQFTWTAVSCNLVLSFNRLSANNVWPPDTTMLCVRQWNSLDLILKHGSQSAAAAVIVFGCAYIAKLVPTQFNID
jgi:hypothetical protein